MRVSDGTPLAEEGVCRVSPVAEIAGRQRGHITSAQLRATGVPKTTEYRWVAGGRLHRVHPGVYLVGHSVPPTWGAEMAALLACAPRAVLSHRTAAALWGLLERPEMVEVTVAGHNPGLLEGVTVHRTRTLTKAQVRRREGFPVTSLERTFIDLAESASERLLGRALAEADAHRRLNRPRLLSLLDQSNGRQGVRVLRALLAEPPFKTKREAEAKLLALLKRAGLTPDATNVKVAGHEVDLLYREAKLVIEVDSWTFHGHRAAFERDRRRDADLLAAGYRTLRITWRQIIDEPEMVIARVAGLRSRT